MLVDPCICLLPLSTMYGLWVSFCLCCSIVNVPSGVSVELIFFKSYKRSWNESIVLKFDRRIAFHAPCACNWQKLWIKSIGACTLLDLLHLVRFSSDVSQFYFCPGLCRGTCATNNGTLPSRWANGHCHRCTPAWRSVCNCPSPWTRIAVQCGSDRVDWIFRRLCGINLNYSKSIAKSNWDELLPVCFVFDGIILRLQVSHSCVARSIRFLSL